MNPLTYAKNLLANIFVHVPLEQKISMVGEEAVVEIAQRDHTIEQERFARHLAVYKLKAVRDWPVKEAV
jgi:hypothetical protein